MRILIHTDEYYPTCAACAYRMKVFAERLIAAGNEVTVIASSSNRASGSTGDRAEKIIFAPAVRMKKKSTLMRMLNNLSFAFTSVIASLFAGRADVVITTSPPPLISISGWLIAKLKRAKLVYDVRDIWPDVAVEMKSFSEKSIFYRVFRLITDFMYRHADMVTTVSAGKVRKIRGKLPGLMRDKVVLISNGFDESVLDDPVDDSVAAEYGLDEGFTCVYIGNIGLAQGLDVMLDIAQNTPHKQARFLLFGTGAEKQRLEARAENAGLDNVRFCGVLPHEKVMSVLRYAKLSFVPLKSSLMKDSVPTKVYEALGVGCPVLLVAEGDACDIVNEAGFGRCVSPDEPEKMQTVFDEIIDNYAELESCREKAAGLMREKYSRQRAADELAARLRELVRV